jgi:cell division initiation protein
VGFLRITPEEIKSHQFKNSFRGYDTLEVRDFLEFIATEMVQLIEEYDKLKNKMQKKDELLVQFQKEEEYLKKAMLSAQQVSEEIQEKAKKEAKNIVQQAEKEKETLFSEARKELEKISMELDSIYKSKDGFIKRLQTTLVEGEKLLKLWKQEDQRSESNGIKR